MSEPEPGLWTTVAAGIGAAAASAAYVLEKLRHRSPRRDEGTLTSRVATLEEKTKTLASGQGDLVEQFRKHLEAATPLVHDLTALKVLVPVLDSRLTRVEQRLDEMPELTADAVVRKLEERR